MSPLPESPALKTDVIWNLYFVGMMNGLFTGLFLYTHHTVIAIGLVAVGVFLSILISPRIARFIRS